MTPPGTTEQWVKSPGDYYQEALESGNLNYFETRPIAYIVLPNKTVMLFDAHNKKSGTSSELLSVIYTTSEGKDQVNFQPIGNGHYCVEWVTDNAHRMWSTMSSTFTYEHGYPRAIQGSEA